MAHTAGPALVGLLIRVVGAPLAVLIDALSYVCAAVTVLSLTAVAEPAPTKPAGLSRKRSARIRMTAERA